jgi:hypothetical protein
VLVSIVVCGALCGGERVCRESSNQQRAATAQLDHYDNVMVFPENLYESSFRHGSEELGV